MFKNRIDRVRLPQGRREYLKSRGGASLVPVAFACEIENSNPTVCFAFPRERESSPGSLCIPGPWRDLGPDVPFM